MYCENCGRKYPKGSVYCEYCGAKLKEDEFDNVVEQPTSENVDGEKTSEQPVYKTYRPESKCWRVFAKLGFVFGLISIIGSFIPFAGLLFIELSVPGIVFSALGMRTKDESAKGKAKAGLPLSIVATVLSIVMYIIYLASFAIALTEFIPFLEYILG